MTKSTEPIMKLNGYSIKDLEYTKEKNRLEKYDSGFQYSPSVGVDFKENKSIVTLKISLKDGSSRFGVKLVIQGQFDISESLSKNGEDAIAEAMFVNGTAILFPYARSVISMITGLDSSSTVLLPTINTTELWENYSDKSKNNGK